MWLHFLSSETSASDGVISFFTQSLQRYIPFYRLSMLSLVIFGAGRIIGSLLGGLVSQRAGIPAVFAFNGAMLLLGCAAFWRPMSRLIREEKEETEKGMEPC